MELIQKGSKLTSLDAERIARAAELRVEAEDENDPTTAGTSESVYIVGEDFDSEEDDHIEIDGDDEIKDEKTVFNMPATMKAPLDDAPTFSRLRLAFIFLAVVLLFSLAFNIYTGV